MRKTCSIIVCLVVLMMSSRAVGEEYTPLYGVHTDFGLVSWYADGIRGFVEDCAEKGYSAIMFLIMGGEKYYFVSPTLERLGWVYGTCNGEDALSVLVEEAHKYNMELFIDLQALAYKALQPDNPKLPEGNPPTPNDVAGIVHELADYGVDGISEEMFLADWFEPVYQACQQTGIVYIHKSINWDFGAMSHCWNTTVFQTYPNCDIMMTEDYDMTVEPLYMAALEQFASIAGGLGKEYWMKASPDDWALRSVSNMENVMLLKAIQLKPRYIFAMIYSGTQLDDFDLSEMTDLIREHVADEEEEKPLCNIVLYLTGDVGPDTWNWWGFPKQIAAISTGIKASGYDILTTNEPIENADMYYIYTRGKWRWGEVLDLPEGIMRLFDSGKPVFLQVTETLPASTPNWQTVRAKLGIDNTVFEDVIRQELLPQSGIFKGIQYSHLGEGSCMNPIAPEHVVAGDVPSTGEAGGTAYALIIRKDNCYFVNGSYLHIQASFPISNLINDGLQGPGDCVATAGDPSVFYALDRDTTDGQLSETSLHIKLPDPRICQIRWFKRDFNGVTSSDVASYDPEVGYMDTLTEGTVLVLRTTATAPLLGDVTGNGEVGAYDAACILRHTIRLCTLTDADSVAADVSGDATLSAYDASLVLQYVVGKIAKFPVEEGASAKGAYAARTIRVGEGDALADGRVCLPLLIDEMEGVVAGEMTLYFTGDGGDGMVRSTDLTSGYLVMSNVQNRRIELSFAGVESGTGSGAMLEVVLNRPSVRLLSSLRLDRVSLNEGMIPVRIVGAKRPTAYRLSQNHPNPFNPETTIQYDLPTPGTVRLSVYALIGQRIRTLVDEDRPAGFFSVTWDGRDDAGRVAASGVYLCRMEAGEYSAVRRMVLVR